MIAKTQCTGVNKEKKVLHSEHTVYNNGFEPSTSMFVLRLLQRLKKRMNSLTPPLVLHRIKSNENALKHFPKASSMHSYDYWLSGGRGTGPSQFLVL
jgi:hypothetical protein